MGLFRPYQRTESASEEPAAPVEADPTRSGPPRKDAPTPTRKEAEQARRERLHPTLTPKQARAKERQARVEQRDSQMRVQEAQPGRVLMRDWVDSRRGLAQFSMPLLMLMLMLSLLVTSFGTLLTAIMSYATWLVMLLIVGDLFLMWRSYKRLHAERLPREPLKGLLSYGINRSINLRRLRLPKPRVKRGDRI
ncbi:MAG: DUF3043 domain-containing protein [Propionibacteriaceae bacterium]|nr:DUF3043 domain-containing protein [Propionibacteriaceae bacterium]